VAADTSAGLDLTLYPLQLCQILWIIHPWVVSPSGLPAIDWVVGPVGLDDITGAIVTEVTAFFYTAADGLPDTDLTVLADTSLFAFDGLATGLVRPDKDRVVIVYHCVIADWLSGEGTAREALAGKLTTVTICGVIAAQQDEVLKARNGIDITAAEHRVDAARCLVLEEGTAAAWNVQLAVILT
jgi:hypothetical protein